MSSISLKNVTLDLPLGRRSLEMMLRPNRISAQDSRIKNQRTRSFVRALDNVSLNITRGQRVGLIGDNGAGKSTLLRVLAEIYTPTEGECIIDGKVSTLFTSVIGMTPDATGRENIFLSARTLGMSRAQVVEQEESIIQFANLGDFINLPMRSYSAGMKARLGFAIATAIKPEILLIDEVFGVGDISFRNSAVKRITQIMDEAGILVMATHSNSIILKFCTTVCWLDKGRIRFFGGVKKGVEKYLVHANKQ